MCRSSDFMAFVALFLGLLIFSAYVAVMASYTQQLDKYEDYDKGTCLASDCLKSESSDCTSNRCQIKYNLWCTYTVITPEKYVDISKEIKVKSDKDSYLIDQEIEKYNNTIQTCYVTSNNIKSTIPDINYLRRVILGFSIAFAIVEFILTVIFTYHIRKALHESRIGVDYSA